MQVYVFCGRELGLTLYYNLLSVSSIHRLKNYEKGFVKTHNRNFDKSPRGFIYKYSEMSFICSFHIPFGGEVEVPCPQLIYAKHSQYRQKPLSSKSKVYEYGYSETN